jgi:hypothetical protein
VLIAQLGSFVMMEYSLTRALKQSISVMNAMKLNINADLDSNALEILAKKWGPYPMES